MPVRISISKNGADTISFSVRSSESIPVVCQGFHQMAARHVKHKITDKRGLWITPDVFLTNAAQEANVKVRLESRHKRP